MPGGRTTFSLLLTDRFSFRTIGQARFIAYLTRNNAFGSTKQKQLAAIFAMAATVLLTSAARCENASDVAALAAACISCHGEGGSSTTQDVPSLAGQPSYFTQWQLVFFRAGSRKNEIMQAVATGLSNDDIRNLANYFQGLAPPKPARDPDTDAALSETGDRLAHSLHCNSCHGETFAGRQAAARIAGQREEVLAKALRDYKASRRAGSGLANMAEVAYPLDDYSIRALAHYLSRVP